MNVFFRELRDNRKSLILWSIGMIVMVAAGMSKYEGMSGADDALSELWSQLPKPLQALMGTASLDISTVIGFFGVMFLFLLIMAAIHAVMLGSSIISKEERDKTSEFLMVKPRSRSEILTAKLAAALANVLILNAVTTLCSLGTVYAFSEGKQDLLPVLLMMAGMLILQLVFLSVGAVIAGWSRNPKTAPSLSTGAMLGAYLLSAVINLTENMGWLSFLTPFEYFKASGIINNGLNPLYILLSGALVAVFTWGTYFFFKKRDLYI